MKRKKIDVEHAIIKIAAQEGNTVEYIRQQMNLAILTGLNNPDPNIRARWKQIPSKGNIPTPEELITYLTIYANSGLDSFI